MLIVGTSQETLAGGFELAPPRTRGRAISQGWALLAAVVIAGVASFNLVWNQFYRGVPFLFDAGWYAHLVYRSAPLLQNPPTVAFATIGRHFYATHFSPALWLLSWPSYLFPVGPQAWLACLVAAEHALLAALVWLAVRRLAPQPTPWQRWGAAVIALLAPFNGIALASMVYPHFESWFVVGAFAFLVALFLGHTRVAVAPFLGVLGLREDMGFHLCAVLVLTALAARLVRRGWERPILVWLGFAAAGFVWSCTALWLMKAFFPGDNAFARIYLGQPPFAHLTWAEMGERLRFCAEARGYIWMPIAVYVVWSMVARCWWVLIGYLTFVPWMLLNFLARSRAPGTLSLYYAFPLGLALLWPVAGHLVFGTQRGQASSCRSAVGWVTAALAVSMVGFAPENGWRALAQAMAFPSTGARSALLGVTARLAGAAADGEAVAIDDAVAAQAPGDFRATDLFGQTAAKPALAALYANGRMTRYAWEITQDLPLHYRVRGTTLIVVSAKPLAWPELELVSARAGSIGGLLRDATHAPSWRERAPAPGMRLLCWGPREWYFRVGETWTATFLLAEDGGAPPVDAICEVVTQHGANVVARATVGLAPGADGSARRTCELTLVIPTDQNAGLEFRVQAPRAAAVRVEDVVLTPRRRMPAVPTAGGKT